MCTLLNESRAPGAHTDVKWDGKSDRGEPVASGVYLYRIVTKGFS